MKIETYWKKHSPKLLQLIAGIFFLFAIAETYLEHGLLQATLISILAVPMFLAFYYYFKSLPYWKKRDFLDDLGWGIYFIHWKKKKLSQPGKKYAELAHFFFALFIILVIIMVLIAIIRLILVTSH